MDRFWAKVKKTDGCWKWEGAVGSDGYGVFQIRTRKPARAHRVAWELTFGPTSKQVLHRCDVPLCVRPDHLFIGTHADNMFDRNQKGRQSRGERHPDAKLTRERVTEIRRRLSDGESQTSIAASFGVAQTLISRIKLGIIWKEI